MKLIENYLMSINEGEDVQNKIIEFFQKNKIHNDEQIHEFANKLDIPPDKLEVEIYKLLSMFINLKHGDDPDDKFDGQQLKRGIEVEKEHIDNPEISKMIAKAHLAEIPDYYTRLDKMEKEVGIKD